VLSSDSISARKVEANCSSGTSLMFSPDIAEAQDGEHLGGALHHRCQLRIP
jgi:hypothetical protein